MTPLLIVRFDFFTDVTNSCFFLFVEITFSSKALLSFLDFVLNVNSPDEINDPQFRK